MVVEESDASAVRDTAWSTSFPACLAMGLIGGVAGALILGWLQQGRAVTSSEVGAAYPASLALVNERIDALYERLDRQLPAYSPADAGEVPASDTTAARPGEGLLRRLQNLERRTTAFESSLAANRSMTQPRGDFLSLNEVRALFDAKLRDYEAVVSTIAQEVVAAGASPYTAPNTTTSGYVTFAHMRRELETAKRDVENHMGDVFRNELRNAGRSGTGSAGNEVQRAIRQVENDMSRQMRDLVSRLSSAERDIQDLAREIR